MPKLLWILGLILPMQAFSTDYFFSRTSGSDVAAGTQSFPFQSIAKFNSLSHSGNRFFFQSNNSWYGTLNINGSGTTLNNIVLSSYGSGAKPIITGFTDVTAWTNLGGNIWESTSAVHASVTATQMVSINGSNAVKGRYPNTGYLTYTAHVNNTQITCAPLAAIRNWSGAELVIRMNRYVLDVNRITGQSGNNFTYTSGDNTYEPANGFGCFVQDDANTLDIAGEWYYSPSTRKVRIYATSSPTNVKVATLDYLVNMTGRNYVKIDGIDFQGSNVASIYGAVTPPTYPTITNSSFNYSGQDAIYFHPNSQQPTVTNNSFNNSNNCAVYLASSDYVTINSNIIRNSGTMAGRGETSVGTYSGIHSYGDFGTIKYNQVINSGYDGMKVDGNGTVVSYNFVDTFCTILDDGSGIYFFPSQSQTTYSQQRTISFNTVLHGIGAGLGTPGGAGSNEADGIYMDGATSCVNVDSNNVAYIGDFGIFFNNSNHCNARGNVVYDCGHAALLWTKYTLSIPVNNNTVYNNQFVAKGAGTETMLLRNDVGGGNAFYVGNNNNFSRPIDDNITIEAYGNNYTLAQWKVASGQDANSTKSPKSVLTTNDLRYNYNSTAGAVTTNLGAGYINVLGTTFPGTITQQPYTSNVLILSDNINTPPTCNAGSDVVLTLPINFCTLNGSGASTTGGSITSYAWTQISGTAATIASPSSAITQITGLTAGVRVFRLTVTDNNALTASDDVTVTTNAALVIPTANAGANQTITLPTNFVTLSGSGSGGTINSYLWTKLVGLGGTFSAATSASTNFSGLSSGIYSVELRVGNTDGNFGRDTMTVTVYNAPTAPTCNAGTTPVSITLPTSTIGLSATGASTSGNTVSFLWTLFSGSGGTITSPTSQSTTATGLGAGNYTYRVTVTDNVNGLTCTSDKAVTVNTAAVPPTVTGGADQTITLPTSTSSVSATAIPSTGSITAILWSIVASPGGSSAAITTPTSLTTGVTNLTVAGTYFIKILVTQTGGLQAADTVRVFVNPVGSIVIPGIRAVVATIGNSNTELMWTYLMEHRQST